MQFMSDDFLSDEEYGERLLISIHADQRELHSNVRAARAILHSFPDVCITINPHTISFLFSALGHSSILVPVWHDQSA